ncbi:LysM peptidoglycan-binding domain-containing protein [Paenibacillus sp. GCM10012307]|uniref:LysM peptidoglycan-binding domain-containing protein n=1 Tax=Paenibacillus roseus TaxID=2798579 RepID=A0A934J7A0_9BACL|nr:LysM peptidoglycan-binding domain-containing protein [Paenibacillus roseus]
MKIHVVKQGESLYTISQKYGVPLDEIIKLNPGIANPNEIDVGLKVKIPSAVTTTPHKPNEVEILHQHVVKQGDTLWKLSKAWGVSLNEVIKANPQLKNPNALLVGEIVNIPKESSGEKVWPESTQSENQKPNTAVQKVSTEQIVKSKKEETAPIAVPTPTPLPEKVKSVEVEKKEKKKEEIKEVKKEAPVHIEKTPSADLFKQKEIPAVEALTSYPLPKIPQIVSPAVTHHGYAVQQHSVNVNIGPANVVPNISPNVSPASTSQKWSSYASPANVTPNWSPNVSPSSVTPNWSPNVSPSSVSPSWSSYASPASVTPNWSSNVSPSSVTPNWSPSVSPSSVTPNWSPSVSPSSVTPNWSSNVSPSSVTPNWSPNVSPSSVAPNAAPNVSPVSVSPNSAPNVSPSSVTPNQPPNISPAQLAPVYYGPQAYSSSFLPSQSPYQHEWPHASHADVWGSYSPFATSPFPDGGYAASPYGDYSYPSQIGGASTEAYPYPAGGYGYSSHPALYTHAQGGFPGFDTAVSPAEGWNYPAPGYYAGASVSPYSSYPVKESAAGHKKPCNCGGDKRTDEQENAATSTVKAAVAPKRKSKAPKKAAVRSVSTSSSSSRESSRSRKNHPWINR